MTSPEAPPASTSRLWGLVRLAAVAVILWLCVHRFVGAQDVARARALVGQVGWPLVLVVLPTFIAMAVDAVGWRLIIGALGHAVSWRRLLELRLSVEALVLALPGGSVAGEVAKVALLSRRTGVPSTRVGASLALTKACLFVTDAAYLLMAATWAWADGRAAGTTTPTWPLALALGAAALTVTLGIALFALLSEASVLTRLAGWLGRHGGVRLRRALEARAVGIAELDQSSRAFFAAPRAQRLRALTPFALEWLVEGAETLLIFRLLGAPLGIGQLLAIDALGSFLRAAIVVVPAGLGVQDAATILLLRAFGAPDAVALGGAFVVIKRIKEVFWIAAGLSFLAVRRDLWRRSDA